MSIQKGKNQKIVVGMSGGIDSSMALILLKEQGWKPIGVSLKYAIWEDERNSIRENVCCSAESFDIARTICKAQDVPYEIIDVAKEFRKEVINTFLAELKEGRTPNPCIVCNKNLKFAQLFQYAQKHGVQYVATGHYAKIKQSQATQHFELVSPRDEIKNQTYMLSCLPQELLSRIVFPLADFTKAKVREMAKQRGFQMFDKRKESQDICFIGNASMQTYLSSEVGKEKGAIQDEEGNMLGKHQGFHFYTIGQRKGLNLSNGPYYVVKKDIKTNTLIVSKKEGDLLAKTAFLSPFTSHIRFENNIATPVMAKIRYLHDAAPALLTCLPNDKARIEFTEPQKAITEGQYIVCYSDKTQSACIGAGRIIDVQ